MIISTANPAPVLNDALKSVVKNSGVIQRRKATVTGRIPRSVTTNTITSKANIHGVAQQFFTLVVVGAERRLQGWEMVDIPGGFDDKSDWRGWKRSVGSIRAMSLAPFKDGITIRILSGAGLAIKLTRSSL